MIVIPAIDLLGGKAVRLLEGRRDRATVYHERPWEVAARFAAEGARLLHVVDLDGAFAGESRHREHVRRIIEASGLPVEVGGGLRDLEAIGRALDAGARWAVLGTAAVRSPATARAACQAFPGRVVVAVDARDGRVAVDGWTAASEITAAELTGRAAAWGVTRVLYTDIARDGTGRGPNVEATRRLQETAGDGVTIIASGGISSLDDLRALAAAGVRECVVGRALYDGAFTLPEAIEAAC